MIRLYIVAIGKLNFNICLSVSHADHGFTRIAGLSIDRNDRSVVCRYMQSKVLGSLIHRDHVIC